MVKYIKFGFNNNGGGISTSRITIICYKMDFRCTEDLLHSNEDVTVQGLRFMTEASSLEVEGKGLCYKKSYTRG